MDKSILTLEQIRIEDPFWFRVRETVRREGIPYQWKALNDEIPGAEPSRCMRNFRIAAGKISSTVPLRKSSPHSSQTATWIRTISSTAWTSAGPI